MTVDVATLVFEFKSDSAAQAEKAMDRLIAKGEQLEGTNKRLRTATDRVTDGHKTATGSAERAAQGAMGLATAQGAVEKATLAAERAEARAARTKEALARQINTIEKALSSEAAVTLTLAERTQRLDKALAAGAITQERHARVLSQANKAATDGTAVMTKYAGAAKLSSSQLANLSFQLNDVVTGLLSGQKFTQIVAQQSGQVFQALQQGSGGVTGSLKGLGSVALSVLGRAGPLAAGVATLGLLTVAMFKGRSEAAAFQNALTATGNYAGLTASSYEDMAARISDATGKSVRESKAGISQLVETGRFSAATIETMVEAAERYSKITGKSTQEILTDYAGMADGVTKWAAKHAMAHHDLTLAQIDRIAMLEKAGKYEEAYQLAVEGIKDSVENRAVPAYGLLQKTLNDVAVAASNMWDKILGIGRPKTIDNQIAGIQTALSEAERKPSSAKVRGADGTYSNTREEELRFQLSNALATKGMQDRQAAADAKKAQDEAAKIDKKYGVGKTTPHKGPSDASEQAVDAAIKAEISARTALTHNVEQVAALKLQEIEAERSAAVNRLERSMREGSVTKAAGEIATAKYAEAAASKKALVLREEEGAIAQRELAQRQAIGSDLERLASIQASNARNATEQGAIEMRAMEARQELDRAALAERTKQQVIWGEITERAAAELAISQLAVQQAETAAAKRAANILIQQEATNLAQAELELQAETLRGQADLSMSAYERSVVGADILALEHKIQLLKAEEAVRLAIAGSDAQKLAQLQLQALQARQAVETELAAREKRLVNAIGEATSAVRGFKDAFRRHDWARVFDEFQRTIQTIQASFAANGMSGGLMTAGAAAGQLIGGKTGNAIGGGLGIAGMGMSAGAGLMGAASMGMLGGGAMAGMAMTLAPLLGPIAIAAGALYAAAKIFNVGGKPTNAGAGFDLRTGAVTGNKRTDETEGAARAAGEAIQGIMDALKAAGVGVTDAVTGLVIGTRDATQIYLQSGRTLTSAVGNSGAAVDTAMRALLDGATYVSDAQKKLVDSAVAAGKGFDAISEILAKYEGAQAISGALADQIKQLTDPKAFDTEAVKRDIEAQRKAYQQLATDGYLTADQLAGINAQLATLEGLKLDEVMKRYADSVDAANDNLSTLRSATESAEGMLMDAYNTYAQAKQAEIDGLRQAAEGLKAFRKELDYGATAGRDPVSQLAATRREFDRLNALSASDPDRLANLQGVSQAFLEASKAASPNQLAFDRDLQAVRRATEASQLAATAQADYAQMQLDQQTAAVGQLIQLNATAVSIAQAIANVLAARANEQAAGGAANDNLDVSRYLAMNPDLARNWNAGGSLHGVGSTLEEAARAHYASAGQYEIAQGLRKYATGGSFMVGGGGGTDSQLVQFMASPDERVDVLTPSQQRSGGGDNSRLEALVENLTAEVASLKRAAEKTAEKTEAMETRDARREFQGVYVRGEVPGDPVATAEAA